MSIFLSKYKYVIPVGIIVVFAVLLLVSCSNSNNDVKTSDINSSTNENGIDNIDNSNSTESSIQLISVDKSAIKEITAEINGEKFIYSRQSNLLVPTYPKGEKLKSNEGEAIASQFKSLYAQSIVDQSASDLAKYGLDKPVIITAKLDDGSSKVLEVGNFTPQEIGIYMKLGNSKTVYFVNAQDAYLLKFDRASMIDTSLFSFRIEDITGFTLDKKGKVFYSAVKAKDNYWNLISPVSTKANTGSLGAILNTVYTVNPIDLAETNASDLKKYGLENPVYGYEIKTAKSKAKILFGNEKVKGSIIYAKLAGSNSVYTVDEKYMSFCKDPIIKAVYPFVYSQNVCDNSKVIAKLDGKTTISEMDATTQMGNSDGDKYKVNNKNGNARDKFSNYYFVRYYNALITLAIDGVDPGVNPKGNPDVTITFYPKKSDVGVTKIDFIPRDNKNYYVVKNGKYSGLIILKDKINVIRETEKQLLDSLK